MTKDRVLIVGAFPPSGSRVYGGVVTACRQLMESSFVERFDVILVDSTQVSNPPPGLMKRTWLAAKRLVLFARSVATKKPAVVLLFASPGASLVEKGIMARFAKWWGVPSLLFPRGASVIDIAAQSAAARAWIRKSLDGATYFLCQGPTWHRFAVEVVGFSPMRAPIVPNWTASEALLGIGRQRRHHRKVSTPQLLFLGWLEKEKGIFELLGACADLALTHEFELVIAGRGAAESEARLVVERSGIGNRVTFAGWVEGQSLERLLSSSDILVLPSWDEGLPNAMIEAMAAGLAVIVSAVGNIPDVLTDNVQARVVQPKQIPELREAIAKMLDDESYRLRIAARGHRFAEEKYAVESAIHLLSDVVYQAIAESRHRVRGPRCVD